MKFSLQKPTGKQFIEICKFIKEFELDNRDLRKEQFWVAVHNSNVLGFGRLRKHEDCMELCSLGVVIPYRRKGIGKAIVKQLIKSSANNIFLVCIIPDFFTPLGFRMVEKFPASIKDKLNYCTQELVVPEKYIAMLYSK